MAHHSASAVLAIDVDFEARPAVVAEFVAVAFAPAAAAAADDFEVHLVAMVAVVVAAVVVADFVAVLAVAVAVLVEIVLQDMVPAAVAAVAYFCEPVGTLRR